MVNNRPRLYTNKSTVPVSYVFREVRNLRYLRHACWELPRTEWHALARGCLSYVMRTWVNRQAIAFDGLSHYRYATQREDPSNEHWIRDVPEVNPTEFISKIQKVVGVRCELCGLSNRQFYHGTLPADAPLGGRYCFWCVGEIVSQGSFVGALTLMVRREARSGPRDRYVRRIPRAPGDETKADLSRWRDRGPDWEGPSPAMIDAIARAICRLERGCDCSLDGCVGKKQEHCHAVKFKALAAVQAMRELTPEMMSVMMQTDLASVMEDVILYAGASGALEGRSPRHEQALSDPETLFSGLWREVVDAVALSGERVLKVGRRRRP